MSIRNYHRLKIPIIGIFIKLLEWPDMQRGRIECTSGVRSLLGWYYYVFNVFVSNYRDQLNWANCFFSGYFIIISRHGGLLFCDPIYRSTLGSISKQTKLLQCNFLQLWGLFPDDSFYILKQKNHKKMDSIMDSAPSKILHLERRKVQTKNHQNKWNIRSQFFNTIINYV